MCSVKNSIKCGGLRSHETLINAVEVVTWEDPTTHTHMLINIHALTHIATSESGNEVAISSPPPNTHVYIEMHV